MKKIAVITGGCGFIGSFLSHHMLEQGWQVRIVDNMLRGDTSRLSKIMDDIELFDVDIRQPETLNKAFSKAQVIFHLAAVNGTENFYTQPELVLDVGLRGMLSVVEACYQNQVPHLVVASSAEVYQTPPYVPTDEKVPLMLPDSLNPRYSYGGSKIVSELIALNYKKDFFEKLQIFRPHNVYGPQMGTKHVIPQFILRALTCKKTEDLQFPMQGDGSETRAFAYVEDVVRGILQMYEYGEHRQIYHIGNDEEVSIRTLATLIGEQLGVSLKIINGELTAGSTPRRCPDITKMKKLGYAPAVNLRQGVMKTSLWYEKNATKSYNNNLI